MVEETLIQVSEQYGFLLDSYVVMPNHIHLIVFLRECNGQKITVGRFVGAMKSIVVYKWIDKCNARGIMFGKLWQRNYYEHILRNEQDYLEKRNYIECNPDKWRMDSEYTEY